MSRCCQSRGNSNRDEDLQFFFKNHTLAKGKSIKRLEWKTLTKGKSETKPMPMFYNQSVGGSTGDEEAANAIDTKDQYQISHCSALFEISHADSNEGKI